MEEKWTRALKALEAHGEGSAIYFTGDKESTLLLELRGDRDIPVIFVDTGLYPPELYQYLEEAESHWGFKAVVLRNERVIEESTVYGKKECYELLKMEVVVPYLMDEGLGTLIEPLKEEFERLEEEGLVRIFPLAGFSELEVWRLIKDKSLPYCRLYNKGFRDVGCEPCSKTAQGEEIDQEEVRRRLKALGYL